MNEHLLTHRNISNLISLWQLIGEASQSFTQKTNYSFNYIENSDWPNRIWFDTTYDFNMNDILNVKNKMLMLSKSSIFPSWEIFDENKKPLFIKHGFKTVFEQIGMNISLNRRFESNDSIKIKTVATNSEAQIFAKTASLAFGYYINSELIEKTYSHESIDFFIAEVENRAIGTGILFSTDNIAGIHAVGVVPDMRRKGIAKHIMLDILKNAQAKNLDYATLQSSDMGKSLYQKLGFQEHFQIHNYALEH